MPSPDFELLLLAVTLGAVVVVIVIRVRRDLQRQRDVEPLLAAPAPDAARAPASFREPPEGLVRVTGGVDATTAESIVQDLLSAGVPAIAKVDHVLEAHSRYGPTFRVSVLVPAGVESQALAIVRRRLEYREKEGTASDAEVERAFLEDEDEADGTPVRQLAGYASRIPAVLLAMLLVACAVYALAKALR